VPPSLLNPYCVSCPTGGYIFVNTSPIVTDTSSSISIGDGVGAEKADEGIEPSATEPSPVTSNGSVKILSLFLNSCVNAL
jgi:hypothetical protein